MSRTPSERPNHRRPARTDSRRRTSSNHYAASHDGNGHGDGRVFSEDDDEPLSLAEEIAEEAAWEEAEEEAEARAAARKGPGSEPPPGA